MHDFQSIGFNPVHSDAYMHVLCRPSASSCQRRRTRRESTGTSKKWLVKWANEGNSMTNNLVITTIMTREEEHSGSTNSSRGVWFCKRMKEHTTFWGGMFGNH